MTLILASASPRRRELLEQLGVAYDCRPADIDETPRAGEKPADYVQRMAREKARSIAPAEGPRQKGVVVRTPVLGKIVNLQQHALARPGEILRQCRQHSVLAEAVVVNVPEVRRPA